MSFIAVFIVTFAITSIAVFGFEFRRHRKHKQCFQSVRMLTGQNDVDGFISKIDADIDRINDAAHLKLLQVNKSTGLFYRGEWAAAITLLEPIDPSSLPREFRALYYNNLLASKLLLDEIDAANQLYAMHLASLALYIPDEDLSNAVGITIGALDYYNGEIPKSKVKLEQTLCIVRVPILKAAAHYFLALIAASEDNHQQAIEHFNAAVVTGAGTWISESAHNHVTALKSPQKEQGVLS